MTKVNSLTVWFTGLHGSGKTTIAGKLIEKLRGKNIEVALLDGDNIRKTISGDLGYSLDDRNEHMKRVADLCRSNSENGILSVACVASPTEESREYARKILENMFLVYVRCPLEVCEKRDVKGHYKKARKKEKGFENFVGISLKFEDPENPDIILETDRESVEESVDKLLDGLKEKEIIG
ncbi:adenylyl-sulfate kinase [archaeon]|jgi:adenylylsulfate kinase|nr:adenylyl-sulfate kinase [archaeon]MDP6548011.1 adenylyl-sulfate kinase [Candidatus Woesearchaeota archaeon]|tara:strand:+ start:2854 stop:3393 length:540 start_codon:yes stop_codon:yes gene_type:complete